jgi:ribosomal protein L35AE/L33A
MSSYIHPITQLVHSTVRIECEDAQKNTSSGSGYIFLFCEKDGQSFPCVVTNKHVVRGAVRATFHLTLKDEQGNAKLGSHEPVTLDSVQQYCINHPNQNIDLVAFPIGPILNKATQDGRAYHFVPLGRDVVATKELLESLPPMEEIVMIGYPNGLWDRAHNLPIIRKGITATHPKLQLNGKREFLIDAACFPGSSGSPVFLANIGSYVSPEGALCAGTRIALLGTLYAGPQHTTTGDVIVVDVPTVAKPIAVGSIPNNLGYVIHASELLVLEVAVQRRLQPVPKTSRNSQCSCGSGKRHKECCGSLKTEPPKAA